MRALVVGGTLFIGRELVRQLLAAGHEVTVLHRAKGHDLGAEVEGLTADRNDGESVRRALAGRRFDLVFDNVYDWQRGTTGEQVVATARACGDSLERYVYMSSVAAFGKGLDHADDDPLAGEDDPDTYVRNKAASERALFRLHREEGFPAVTLRPPFVYGPGNPFYREAFFWDRMADDRPIIIPGRGDRLMQFAFVKDLARACLLAAERPQATGRGFNIGNVGPITQQQLVVQLASAAGMEPRLVQVPRERIEAAGGSVFGPDNLYFGLYYDMPPITQKIDGARAILGFEPTNFAAGLEETYTWYRKNRLPRKPGCYDFEDRLLRGDE